MARHFGNRDYITIRAPDYPGYKYKGLYCYEHQYVWWKNTGHVVIKGDEEIHHINGNKKDNRFENLKLMSRIEHFNEHFHGNHIYILLKCPCCKEIFERPLHRTHLSEPNKKKGKRATYCSRSCAGKFNQYNPITEQLIDENVVKIYSK